MKFSKLALKAPPFLVTIIPRVLKVALGSISVQGILIAANIVLFTTAVRKQRRARFATSVRLIKELDREGLELLIRDLPAWVKFSDWERAATLQAFINVLWPSLNSVLCSLLKREIEQRLQGHRDFGHVLVQRLSFGRHPPTAAGIKAVPMLGDDTLAMVVDIDVRWAGEPDVALQLTKLRGVTVGLSTLQVSGVFRLILDPIIEDPPFIKHITLYLLEKPFLDFDLRLIGGPDLMSLPALSGWLSSAIHRLAVARIVYPHKVGIPIGGHRHGRQNSSQLIEELERPLPEPLGVLVVEVLNAQVEPRRSMFLGRLKPVTPRVFLLLPPGPDAPSCVIQAGFTGAQPDTLAPVWQQTFQFVVTSASQKLRLLLSHKRKGMTGVMGADMPLGSADVAVMEVLNAYESDRHETYNSFSDNDDEAESEWATPLKSARSDGESTSKYADAESVMGSFTSQGLSPDFLLRPPSSQIALSPMPSLLKTRKTPKCDWLADDGVWVPVPSTQVLTLAGLLAEALEPSHAEVSLAPAPTKPEGWLNKLQEYVLGEEENDSDDDYDMLLQTEEANAARLHVRLRWEPTVPPPATSLGGSDSMGISPISSRETFSIGSAVSRTNSFDTSSPPGLDARKAVRRGVLAVRIVHTKLEYARTPIANPLLAVSIIRSEESISFPTTARSKAVTSVRCSSRLLTMEAVAGARPGTLHWGQVFHVPVEIHEDDDERSSLRLCIELGDASSASKFILFGAELYCLDAQSSFDSDVSVMACATAPIKELSQKSAASGTWRLREALQGSPESERLAIGTAHVQTTWFTLSNGEDAMQQIQASLLFGLVLIHASVGFQSNTIEANTCFGLLETLDNCAQPEQPASCCKPLQEFYAQGCLCQSCDDDAKLSTFDSQGALMLISLHSVVNQCDEGGKLSTFLLAANWEMTDDEEDEETLDGAFYSEEDVDIDNIVYPGRASMSGFAGHEDFPDTEDMTQEALAIDEGNEDETSTTQMVSLDVTIDGKPKDIEVVLDSVFQWAVQAGAVAAQKIALGDEAAMETLQFQLLEQLDSFKAHLKNKGHASCNCDEAASILDVNTTPESGIILVHIKQFWAITRQKLCRFACDQHVLIMWILALEAVLFGVWILAMTMRRFRPAMQSDNQFMTADEGSIREPLLRMAV